MDEALKQYKKRRRKHRLLGFQTKVINALNRCAFCVLVLFVCMAAHVFYLPQYHVLAEKNALLSEAKLVEEVARQEKDKVMRENRALQEDPAYLELIARDTLDYYRPGEIIFEVNRSRRKAQTIKELSGHK